MNEEALGPLRDGRAGVESPRAHHGAGEVAGVAGRGGACSGYLVEANGICVLLDCGYGVFGKLRAHREYWEVDAVVISHLHADHILDLVPYASALTYAPRQQPVPVGGHPGTDPARPRLIAPAGAPTRSAASPAPGCTRSYIERAFELQGVRPRRDGPRSARSTLALPARAALPARRTRSSCATGGGAVHLRRRLAPNEALSEFARDTDLLLIEATLPRPERDGPARAPHARRRPASTAAGRAPAARAHALLRRARRRVGARRGRAAFGGPVEVAREGAVYELCDRDSSGPAR